MDQRFLTSTEAAEYLNVPRKSLYELVRLRRIPYRKRGGTLVFLRHELEQWMEQLPGVKLSDVQWPRETVPILPVQAWQQPAAAFEMPLVRRPQPPKIPYDDPPKHRKGADRAAS